MLREAMSCGVLRNARRAAWIHLRQRAAPRHLADEGRCVADVLKQLRRTGVHTQVGACD